MVYLLSLFWDLYSIRTLPPEWSFENINRIKLFSCSKRKKRKKKRIKWLHIPSGIKTKLFTVAYEVLLVWLCLPLWALNILQTYTTSFCFSNMPNSLLPHSFCIWSRWLEHFFIGCLKAVSFSPFRSQLKCHLLRKAFPYHLFKAILTSPQPYSITLSSLIVWIEFNTAMKVSHLFLQRENNSLLPS